MTDKEKIKSIIELFIAWNGEKEVIDIANLDSAVDFIIDSLPEEPISESIDFERELYKWFGQVKDFTLGMRIAKHFYKAGAQWQKEVFEKNRLAACDRATKEEIEREQDFVDKVLIGEQRQPTFSDAIEYGIKWQKQKIIDKACNFLVDAGKYMKYNPIDDEYKFNAQQLVKDFRKYMEE